MKMEMNYKKVSESYVYFIFIYLEKIEVRRVLAEM